MTAGSLGALFRPRSVAIVGASPDATRIGGRPVAYLRTLGYRGAIYPVNPNYAEVQGLPAFKSLSAIGQPVDLAIIAVAAARVPETLAEARALGVGGIVLFSSGFAEIGDVGRRAQDEITRLARASGMRILGPNCLGLMSGVSNVYATFSPVPQSGVARRGVIGLASQSGAFGAYAYALARDRGLGLSHWITTGNEADVELADAIAFYAGDPDTEVVLAYCEGVRRGDAFLDALAAARAAGKPVVITKVGRTEIGAAAASSHTAALAGEDAVYDAVFEQYGAIRARTVEELFDLGYAFSTRRKLRGNRLAIVTVSGGVGVLMADEAVERGVDLQEPPAAAQAKILQRVPFAAVRNPVDVTGQAANDHALWDDTLDALLADEGYDAVALFFSVTMLSPDLGPKNMATCLRLRAKFPDVLPILVGVFAPAQQQTLEEAGCLCFGDPTRAVRTFAAVSGYGTSQSLREARIPQRIDVRPGPYTEPEALELLGAHGIPVVAHAVAKSADEAVAAAARVGYPVAMKIVSRDVLHKTDAGGVLLNVASAEAVRSGYPAIVDAVRRHAPAALLDGVLVSPMVGGGVECILGVKRDPVFGPIVMFGLGGVHVEVLRDVSLRHAPFDDGGARAMIDAIRGRRLLDGVRGQPPADVDALARTLVALSELAAAAGDSLASLDVNPFVALPRGRGAVALDGVVIGRSD